MGGRVAAAHGELVVLAKLADGGGLAGGGRAGDDQAAAGAELVAVEQDQPPAGGHDLADHGGCDDDQPRVVAQTMLLVAGTLNGVQLLALGTGEQRWWRWDVVDEPAPALLGGQRRVDRRIGWLLGWVHGTSPGQ